MPIAHPEPPAPSLEVVRAHLGDAGAELGDPDAFVPHRVFDLGFDDILEGRRLDAANLIAWRYVFRGEDNRHHVIEIACDEGDDEHTMHHVNVGRHVDNFIDLYERIHEHGTVHERDYEMSVLRVPACYVLAVWFNGTDHDHEFLVPLAPVHNRFSPNQHYERDEFADLLESAAQDMVDRAGETNDPDGADVGADVAEADESMTDIGFGRLLGVTPEVAEVLNSADIVDVDGLAAADPGELEAWFEEFGIRYHYGHPSALVEQARMALADDHDELSELQAALREEHGDPDE